MKKIILASVLTLVIFLSGCTTDNQGGGGTGIIIESFYPAMETVEPGEAVDIIARVKNTGGSDATDITANIYGLGDWRVTQTSPIPSVIEAGDPARKIQPEAIDVSWEAIAPSYKTGVDNQEFELRIQYKYSTSAVAQIRVASDSYIKGFPADQQQAKRDELGVKMQIPTDGPISITFDAPGKVVKSGSTTLSVVVNIQNIGGGSLVNNQLDTFQVTSNRHVVCSVAQPIKLISGQSKQVRCTINVDMTEGWDVVPIEVHTSYRYWVSAKSSINVLPTEN
ncbi:MAG: hypothetical protein N3D75_01795 [Candidatus Aenigmarchaeota archaeon]|nr:hypothetical protein [Candidatus Aenigmarchaeota archaeon]